MKDIKFILIILLMFFGGGIMEQINDYDYNVNNTGIMYQENENIVLNEINRTYDYNINYNLDESYLHYSPVKKGGLLDNYNQSKNLAIPDLTGKDYLGNGVYSLYDLNGITLDYNIFSGIYTLNGQTPELTSSLFILIFSSLNIELESTYSYIYVSGSSFGSSTFLRSLYMRGDLPTRYWSITPYNSTLNNVETNVASWRIYLQGGQSYIFDNYEFKVQIEEGTTATPYEVPYIPGMIIDFKGSNQVEHINPYKEQLIKINDINNVNNIEFELLNTKNPVVYNWNITTNPNMPFVRFYNDETKLLYDFTDIDEINEIGNNLFGKRSKGITAFNSALDLVNTFYQGFQKLFNNEVIDTIGDYLRYLRLGINLPLELIKRR